MCHNLCRKAVVTSWKKHLWSRSCKSSRKMTESETWFERRRAPLMATCPAAAVHLWSKLTAVSLWLRTRANHTQPRECFSHSDCGNYHSTQSSFSGCCRRVCVLVVVCVCVCGLGWRGRSLLPSAQWLVEINVWFAGYLMKDLMLKHAPRPLLLCSQ